MPCMHHLVMAPDNQMIFRCAFCTPFCLFGIIILYFSNTFVNWHRYTSLYQCGVLLLHRFVFGFGKSFVSLTTVLLIWMFHGSCFFWNNKFSWDYPFSEARITWKVMPLEKLTISSWPGKPTCASYLIHLIYKFYDIFIFYFFVLFFFFLEKNTWLYTSDDFLLWSENCVKSDQAR